MQLTAFVDAGGTLVDTADVYCDGESERTLGHLLTDVVPRSDVLVATKAVGRTGPGPMGRGRLPRAPARRARRLAGAARAGLRRPLAAARLGRRHAARGDPGRLRPGRLLRPGPLRRHQQLHRLADRAGRDLAARLAGAHPAGQHPGRVLAAAARRGARGRAGRRVARAGRAGLVAAGPRAAHRQVPAQHAVGVPGRLAAVAGLHRRPAVGEVRPHRRGGDHRRRGPGHHARWRSPWPGSATGPASSPRSWGRAPPSSCRPRSTPTASGCPRRSAPRWRTSPRRRSAIPSAGPTGERRLRPPAATRSSPPSAPPGCGPASAGGRRPSCPAPASSRPTT